MNILKAWGVLKGSPKSLSAALDYLEVNHSLIGMDEKRGIIRRKTRKHRSKGQGKWPVIVDSIETFHKLATYEKQTDLIVYVFCSRPEVTYTNLSPLELPNDNLMSAVKYSLLNLDDKPFEFEEFEPTLSQYISMASKPSALSDLLTITYKVNPYAQQKKVQLGLFKFFAGQITKKKLHGILSQTLRGDEIKAMIETEECKLLERAVKEAREGDPEAVAAKFNLDVFDLNYVLISTKQETK